MRNSVSRITIWLLLIFLMIGVAAAIINQGNRSIDAAFVPGTSGDGEPGGKATNEPEGFARAQGPIELQFPRDHGPHPDYQTEWWYYTGNLEASDGNHFGYQLTFFRRALIPEETLSERRSDWATNQVYMAHFALTAVKDGDFYNFERFSRGALELAGAQALPYRVWLHDWQVEQLDERVYQLKAEQADVSILLQLTDVKGPILHGIDGYSKKGPQPGNASHYISQTRLETSGEVTINGQEHTVTGTSWMDHEFSTSALSGDQVGWDWFSIQVKDEKGSQEGALELMVFQIRKEDGSIDPHSGGTIIYPDGATRTLHPEDFEITSLASWRSPRTGATYPAQWLIIVPAEELRVEIEPYVADQELNVSFDYWEGAVRIGGTWQGQTVAGSGYVELTGYTESIAGEF
ncbi:MAG TPA: lipocalin-like domain-containing protein [Anaerolineales bacterium]